MPLCREFDDDTTPIYYDDDDDATRSFSEHIGAKSRDICNYELRKNIEYFQSILFYPS